MNSPVIGITTNQDSDHLSSIGIKSSTPYEIAVRAAGGSPMLIPNKYPLDRLADLRSRLDGILLSGGGDIATRRYHGQEDLPVSGVSDDRDNLEIALVKLAIETDWPFLGICRGAQVINVALGGNLYTDIPTQYPTSIHHKSLPEQGRDFIAHQVKVSQRNLLCEILQMESLPVNSHHHQAVQETGKGLIITARAGDGLIEGIELPGHRFGLGVQWHPECLTQNPEQCRLFEAFIQAARV